MAAGTIQHPTYADYAEYAYATGELKGVEEEGLTKEQQLCFVNAALNNLPDDLEQRLNAYARNELRLVERDYEAMVLELEPFLEDEAYMKAVYRQLMDYC